MRVLIEGTTTPTIYKFDGQAATLRIEAIKGFTTFNGQMVPPSNGNEQDFYLEVPLTIANDQMEIPTIEIDSTTDAYPWDSPTTGDVPGYRAYIKLANGRKIPFFPKFKVHTLADDDPSHTWDELRVFNRAFIQRFTALDRVINVNMAQEWIQNAVGELNKASETNFGVTMLDEDPVIPGVPIAVGVNSPLLSTSITTGISVLDHGAVADAVAIEDAIISLSTPSTLTSVAGGFNETLIGKAIVVAGAGAAGVSLPTTISAVPDENTLTLADAASTAVSGTRAVYGTDNSTAFQDALDAAAVSTTTRIVFIPKGNYLFTTGALVVAQGVQLQGSWPYAPDHMGYRLTDQPKPMSGDGTTLVITAGEGSATGAFIFLNSESALRGICAFYPLQLATRTTPLLYPWFVEMFGAGPHVEHCELINPYLGIYSHIGQRHRVRDVKGQPVSVGLYVSQQLETSIYSDINFQPGYTFAVLPETPPYPMTQLMQWIHQNGTAFRIGRVDNAQFTNCFTFAYNKGFKFVIDAAESTTFANGTGAPGGKAWAQFVNCQADTCANPVDVDDVQGLDSATAAGVTFDACMFASAQWFAFSADLYGVYCRSTFTGRIGLVNCRFTLGVVNIVNAAFGGRLNIIGCYFQAWTVKSIDINGTATIVGCTFKLGSVAPVIVSTATGGNAAWIAVAGNMIEYTQHTAFGIHADANFEPGGNSYLDSPKWVAPTLQNGWVNFGGGYQTARYIKRDNWVVVQGVIKDGTATVNTTLLTLPTGFRPPSHLLFAADSNGAHGLVQVASDGVVTIQAGSSTSLTLNLRFSIR